MQNVVQDEQGYGLAEPPESQGEVDPDTQQWLNQVVALKAKDEWDLIKKYWEDRKKHFSKRLTQELAGQSRNPKLMGELYMVSVQLADEADAFITWIEENAKAEERRRAAATPRRDRPLPKK